MQNIRIELRCKTFVQEPDAKHLYGSRMQKICA